jgi:glycosyltransferase involved in cell wall biosynthesis
VLPPLVFGLGVLWHLLRRGRRYDVVHTASFPYFSLLAAAAARRVGGYGLVVDWFELWSREYWREYLGAAGGRIGWAVQRRCLRVRQRAFCFARVTAERLQAEGVRGPVEVLTGIYEGPLEPRKLEQAEAVVVFAGRHIPEKRAPAVVGALAELPDLRAVIFGDGPERDQVLAEIERLGLGDRVRAPGFVATEEVDAALASALCMLLPSRREGFGLIVVEAASHGTPSVVVRDIDNASVELIEEGVNGFVAPSADPRELAAVVERVREAGPELRRTTALWFAQNARRLSVTGSLDAVAAAYRSARS